MHSNYLTSAIDFCNHKFKKKKNSVNYNSREFIFKMYILIYFIRNLKVKDKVLLQILPQPLFMFPSCVALVKVGQSSSAHHI